MNVRTLSLLVALAATTPFLAGCLQTGAPVDPGAVTAPAGDVAKILPYLDLSDDHNHSDPTQHESSWNIDRVGHNFLSEDVSKLGRYNQVQYRDGYAYVSAYSVPPEYLPGMIVLDVKDPANPVVVGRYTTKWTTPIDVALSDDGKTAFLAGHRNSDGEALLRNLPQSCTGLPQFNACVPFVPAGVIAVDVSDPANPKEVATYMSAPSGAHTVKYATLGGKGYVFIASYGFTSFNRLVPSVEIASFENGEFQLVGRYLMKDLAYATDGASFVHDMWVEPEHAILKKPLLYVAHWDAGVRIVDLSDPADPQEIAVWNDFDAATYGNIHFVRPAPALIQGKHITVAAPEYGSAEHAGMMWILDTTDPVNPVTLGTWTMPGDPVSEEAYRYSPHNFDITPEGKLVYGHYHGGIWVLDIGTNETLAKPKVLGFHFTTPPTTEGLSLHEDAPYVWNAVWTDTPGLIVASDIVTGLYTLRLGDLAATQAPPYEGLV